jgi:tol-pal system protein YbgF
MRQARVIRYLLVAVFLLLLAACGQFPGMRTPMPPTPAETPPGAGPPDLAPGPVPAPDLAQQVQNLEVRVQQLEGQLGQLQSQTAVPAPGATKPRTPPAPAAASPKAATPGAAGPGSEKNYNEGMRFYHAKKYSEAQTQLHQYLKSQPKGPKAPEARYYLADSFYQEGKFKEAGVEFNKLRLQFPKSILAPAGLLRQALCYKNQQQMGTYRTTLQKLVKAYPNSPEAKEAQKMLKEGPKGAAR